jgi:hypothetical protein
MGRQTPEAQPEPVDDETVIKAGDGQQIADSLGLDFKGVQKTPEGHPDFIMLNDPQSGTAVAGIEGQTVGELKAHLQEMRSKFDKPSEPATIPTPDEQTGQIAASPASTTPGELSGQQPAGEARPGSDVGARPGAGAAGADQRPDIGISQARTEAELGQGSVEPGVGAELGSGLDYGRNYINQGGDPRLPIRRALKSGLVGKNEVGIVHAELERLRGIRNQAAQVAEQNRGDALAQQAFQSADNAQRAWRKELQPVLTKASDALREAYAESGAHDVGTYDGLSNLVDEHFKGKLDLTPEDRTALQKAAKTVDDARKSTAKSVDRAVEETGKRAKRIMSPDELTADLASELNNAFKDCVL